MSCYRPLIFQKLGIDEHSGKKIVRILNFFSGNYDDYDSKHYIKVPCGQCIGCRLDYARIWGERCSLEASGYKENCFVTLTYDDKYLPLKANKKDFDLFIKRVRNHFKDRKIRYFGCGEYGSNTHRFHMHIILFNCDFNDKKYYKTNKNGDALFTSETLSKLWPYGFSTVGDCNYKTCNYTARYILKKQKGEIKTDEYVKMSNHPGIGYDWFINHYEDLLTTNMIYFSFDENKKTTNINKYYKKLMQKMDLDLSEENDELVIKRIEAKNLNDRQLYNVPDTKQVFETRERLKKASIRSLHLRETE